MKKLSLIDFMLKKNKWKIVEFCSKEIISERRNKYNFYFWDIGGQERYIHMTHCFYKDADFCLVIFDITNRESFLACAKWKKDLDDKYMLKSGKSCPCLLIGNKVY
jgi:GTPase SAR1 family protein